MRRRAGVEVADDLNVLIASWLDKQNRHWNDRGRYG